MKINNKNKYISWIIGISSVSLFILSWEIISRYVLTNQNLLPEPLTVFRAIFRGILNGDIIFDSLQSIKRVFIGFAFGSVLGLSLGTLSALKKQIGYAIRPIVELIRPIPPIAWIPLALLWFGFGEPSAYFLVALGAFFPVFSNTFLGISSVDRGTVEVANCYGASKKLLFLRIIIPQSLSSIFTGLTTGLGVSWMIVITAELVGAQSGLGYWIQISRAQLQAEQVVAGMVMIGIIGYMISYIMKRISKMMMPWRWRGKEIGYGE